MKAVYVDTFGLGMTRGCVDRHGSLGLGPAGLPFAIAAEQWPSILKS